MPAGRLAANLEDLAAVTNRPSTRVIVSTVALIVAVGLGFFLLDLTIWNKAAPGVHVAKARASAPVVDSVEVSEGQLGQIKLEQIPLHTFVDRREAVGNIDFNQERTAQVYSPYTGRILSTPAKAGDDVAAGAVLFTIDSPDLAAAESALIGAAATRELTARALERAQGLYQLEGYAQKDYEQAVSDAQTAEGAYQSARDTVLIFGKTEADLRHLVATRKVDSVLAVRSPFAGRVVARNAAPGTLAQPGAAMAPYTVADLSTVWLLAGVAESDVPAVHVGQPVSVRVSALPGRVFRGKVDNVSAGVDPVTHRATVRAEVQDPKHELKPQMLASFAIDTSGPRETSAMPVSGVVREGDGTMTVWVTADRHRFTRRTVTVGLEQDGYVEILSGVKPGELVATDGALFLSNALVESIR